VPVANEPMHSTLALFASSRRNGNTGQLVDRVANELRIEVVDLAKKNMSAFDYVLKFEQIIFATPVYWYSVCPPMKVFLDRISDLLEVPDLLPKGRQLRGKGVYVLCTSIEVEPDPSFVSAWQETCKYLGMNYRGLLHANCRDGYVPALYESEIEAFVRRVQGFAC
jgi:multimeric flavodoxin WrbA